MAERNACVTCGENRMLSDIRLCKSCHLARGDVELSQHPRRLRSPPEIPVWVVPHGSSAHSDGDVWFASRFHSVLINLYPDGGLAPAVRALGALGLARLETIWTLAGGNASGFAPVSQAAAGWAVEETLWARWKRSKGQFPKPWSAYGGKPDAPR